VLPSQLSLPFLDLTVPPSVVLHAYPKLTELIDVAVRIVATRTNLLRFENHLDIVYNDGLAAEKCHGRCTWHPWGYRIEIQPGRPKVDTVETIIHELIHAGIGLEHRHNGRFQKYAKRCGLCMLGAGNGATGLTGALRADLYQMLGIQVPAWHVALLSNPT
jgi:hypothetical protein